MEQVPVTKSTISLWLRSVGLSKRQKQRLTEKKLNAIKRGAAAKHQQQIILTKEIMSSARKEIGKISQRELWLIGVMLYWAEGSKEKDYKPGNGLQFTNSDPKMIALFLHWLKRVYHKTLDDIIVDVYIHELQKGRTGEIVDFRAGVFNTTPAYFGHIYYKKGNPRTQRKNVGDSYHGVIKIKVRSSSKLQRQIAG